MIKITAYRKKEGMGKHELGSPHEQPLLEALKSLVVYELGYGGFATEITTTRVVVETRVMSCLDTTIFEGSAKEMEPIVTVAALHTLIAGKCRETLINKTSEVLGNLPEGARGVPFYIAATAPMILGEFSVKPAVMFGMGIIDEADLKAGMNLSTKDLFEVLELKQENPGVSLKDIISRVTPAAT